MDRPLPAPLLAGALFVGMLLSLELGRYLGERRRRLVGEGEKAGLGALEGAIFALFGLLIAFTFSGAAERFLGRRALIVEEANYIGTAYRRIDLVAPEAQPALRELFRRYVDSRLETYRRLPDVEAALRELAQSYRIQEEIWKLAVPAAREPGAAPFAGLLLLPAINEMIDITSTRMMSHRNHPPAIIFALLIALGLVCALLAGYGMASGRRSVAHVLAFAAITAITVYVIIDLEYPRFGWIRIDAADRALVEVREGMR
jgi:hypothetical protein